MLDAGLRENFYSYFILACLLCVVLGVVWKGKLGFLKAYRDEDQGLPDLLRWAGLASKGVVLGKNGELIAGFFFRGVDLDSATDGGVMGIMAQLNSALSRFGSGWMAHVEVVRGFAVGYPTQGHFPHPILRAMDEERRAQFEAEGLHYDSQYAIVLTWLPPTKLEARAVSLLFDHSEDVVEEMGSLGERTLKKFEDRLREFSGELGMMFHNVLRMGSTDEIVTESSGATWHNDTLLSFLHYCLTGIQQDIRVSHNCRTDVDLLIGSYDFTGGARPRIGRTNIRIVSIEGFPSEAAPLVLRTLDMLPVRFRWSTRYIFEDAIQSRTKFDSIRSKWLQKVRPVMDQITGKSSGAADEHAVEMARDAQGAMSEVSSGLVRYGDYTSVVVLMDEDSTLVNDAAENLDKLIRNIGFACRIEEMNSVEAFLGSLPGHGYENCRILPVGSLNLAYLFPAAATWCGLTKHPNKEYPPNSPAHFMADSSGGTPFGVCLSYLDIGHHLGIGPTGAGKSTFLMFCIAQFFRFLGAKVFLFEKGYSGYALCKGIKGKHFDIGGEHYSGGFAPLADVDKPHQRIWAEDWVAICLSLHNISMTPGRTKKVREALLRLGQDPRDSRTMTNFVAYLQDTELKGAMEFYTIGGENEFLDKKPSEETLELSRFNVFEMEHMMEMGEKYLMPILLYLLRKIELSLDGTPVIIGLDEAWLPLKNKLFMDRLEKWLRTMRKAIASLGFFTQDLTSLASSPIKDILFTSCPTKILLPNRDAGSEDQRLLYRQMGLNDQQINLIAGAIPKHDYYYTSPYGSRLFQLSLGPMCLAFSAVSSKEDVALVRKYEEKYGDRWPVEWTKLRAGKDWAFVLEKYYEEAANDGLAAKVVTTA